MNSPQLFCQPNRFETWLHDHSKFFVTWKCMITRTLIPCRGPRKLLICELEKPVPECTCVHRSLTIKSWIQEIDWIDQSQVMVQTWVIVLSVLVPFVCSQPAACWATKLFDEEKCPGGSKTPKPRDSVKFQVVGAKYRESPRWAEYQKNGLPGI